MAIAGLMLQAGFCFILLFTFQTDTLKYVDVDKNMEMYGYGNMV